jgi:hypothetical protein
MWRLTKSDSIGTRPCSTADTDHDAFGSLTSHGAIGGVLMPTWAGRLASQLQSDNQALAAKLHLCLMKAAGAGHSNTSTIDTHRHITQTTDDRAKRLHDNEAVLAHLLSQQVTRQVQHITSNRLSIWVGRITLHVICDLLQASRLPFSDCT